MIDQKLETDLDVNYNQLIKALLWRMNNAERAALATTLTGAGGYLFVGLPVFDTDDGLPYMWCGSSFELMIGGSGGSIVGANNLGTGSEIYTTVSANKINLRSILGGDGITATQLTNSIEIKLNWSGVNTTGTLTDLIFTFGSRTLEFTNNGTFDISLNASVPQGLEFYVICKAVGGDLIVNFPTGSKVAGGARNVVIPNGEDKIIKIMRNGSIHYYYFTDDLRWI